MSFWKKLFGGSPTAKPESLPQQNPKAPKGDPLIGPTELSAYFGIFVFSLLEDDSNARHNLKHVLRESLGGSAPEVLRASRLVLTSVLKDDNSVSKLASVLRAINESLDSSKLESGYANHGPLFLIIVPRCSIDAIKNANSVLQMNKKCGYLGLVTRDGGGMNSEGFLREIGRHLSLNLEYFQVSIPVTPMDWPEEFL